MPHSILQRRTLYSMLHPPSSILHTPDSIIFHPHSTLPTAYSMLARLHISYAVLHIEYSTFHIPHPILHIVIQIPYSIYHIMCSMLHHAHKCKHRPTPETSAHGWSQAIHRCPKNDAYSRWFQGQWGRGSTAMRQKCLAGDPCVPLEPD